MYMRVCARRGLPCSSFRELMKLGCKGNCCGFHLYKVFRWYGLTISTPSGSILSNNLVLMTTTPCEAT